MAEYCMDCRVRDCAAPGNDDGACSRKAVDGPPGGDGANRFDHHSAEIAARFVVRLVACAMQTETDRMLACDRGPAEVARARQIAMYLLHTALSVPYGDVGAMFGRDRTTVSHACRTVEDMPDDPAQDDFILGLEEMVELARSMAGAISLDREAASARERHP